MLSARVARRKGLLALSMALAATAGCGQQEVLQSAAPSTTASRDQGTGVEPAQVPELAAVSRVFNGPGVVPAETAADCETVLAELPHRPFTLPAIPAGVSSDPVCLPEGENRVSLLYLAEGASPEQELDELLSSGSILLMTHFDGGQGRPPLPGSDGQPASKPEAGYARAELGKGIGSRVWRIEPGWVNVVWHSRLRNVPVTGMLAGGRLSPSEVAQIASSLVRGDDRVTGPAAQDTPAKGPWQPNTEAPSR